MAALPNAPIGSWTPDDLNTVLPYAMLRMNYLCPLSRKNVDLNEEVFAYMRRLSSKTVEQVRLGALARNPSDILELAVRCCSGVTAPKDDEAAAELLAQLVHDNPSVDVSRTLRARAWALMGHIHYERRIAPEDPDCWNIDSLYRAAKCANESCLLGFVCPGTLSTGMAVERAGFRRQEDCKFPGWDTKRFADLEALWEAVDRRKAEIQFEEANRDRKLQKDPNAYICATEGCGIEATHKAALLRCAGKCITGSKPSYCSKECQKKDWKRHKPFCREDAPLDEYAASMRKTLINPSPVSKPMNLADTETWGPRIEYMKGRAGVDRLPLGASSKRMNEHRLKFPGPAGQDDVLVTSSTMDPAEMKEIKAYVEKELEERVQGSS